MLDLPVMLFEDFLYDLIYAECKCKEFISGGGKVRNTLHDQYQGAILYESKFEILYGV